MSNIDLDSVENLHKRHPKNKYDAPDREDTIEEHIIDLGEPIQSHKLNKYIKKKRIPCVGCCLKLFLLIGSICLVVFFITLFEIRPYNPIGINNSLLKPTPFEIDLGDTDLTHVHHSNPLLGIHLKNPYVDKCTNPYGHWCTSHHKQSMFVKANELNKKVVQNMKDMLSSDNPSRYDPTVNTINFKSLFQSDLDKHSITTIDQLKTLDINEKPKGPFQHAKMFFKTCVQFKNKKESDKYKIISNHPTIEFLLNEVIEKQLKTINDLSKVMGILYSNGINVPINVDMRPLFHNIKNPKDQLTLSIEQSGVPLSFLMLNDEIDTNEKKEILEIIFRTIKMVLKPHIEVADNIDVIENDALSIQTMLYNNGIRYNMERDTVKAYKLSKLMTLNEFQKELHQININEFLQYADLPIHIKIKNYNVHTLEFFKQLDQNINTFTLEQWKNYLKVNTITTILKELKMLLNDWRKEDTDECYQMTYEYFPMTMCRVFQDHINHSEYHNQGDAQRIEGLVQQMIRTYTTLITNDPEMFSIKTKKVQDYVIKKMQSISVHAGKCTIMNGINKVAFTHPEWIEKMMHNERSMKVLRNSTMVDIILEFHKSQLFRLQRHADFDTYYQYLVRSETSLNAWFDSLFNQVVIPNGFIQYPFHSMNYKSWQIHALMMTIIGHELFHALEFWLDHCPYLTKEERQGIEKLNKCMIDLYQDTPDQSPKDWSDRKYGKRTVHENKADHMGVYIAYMDWKNETIHNGKSIDLTRQHYFAFYHQIWCTDNYNGHHRDDPHAGMPDRGKIPLIMLRKEYMEAFKCKTFSDMRQPCFKIK